MESPEQEVDRLTAEVNDLGRRTSRDAFEGGRTLHRIKELKEESFSKHCKDHIRFSRQTAYALINLWERFRDPLYTGLVDPTQRTGLVNLSKAPLPVFQEIALELNLELAINPRAFFKTKYINRLIKKYTPEPANPDDNTPLEGPDDGPLLEDPDPHPPPVERERIIKVANSTRYTEESTHAVQCYLGLEWTEDNFIKDREEVQIGGKKMPYLGKEGIAQHEKFLRFQRKIRKKIEGK
jgi:hypothetical protein